nr:hypothetical protein [Tanacetum cinerariifolium]
MATLNEPLPQGLVQEKDSLSAQEDASKQGRSIKDIDQDVEIALFDEARGRMHDAYLFGVDDLEVIDANVEDSVALTNATTTDINDELTLEKTLIAIKAAKPKVISTAATIVTTAITTPRAKVIVFHEQVQAHIPTVSSSKDKGKAKMIEPEKPLKKKDQITLDKEVARKLVAEMKAKMGEEERIAREKNEANKAIIEEWDDVQAIIDADKRRARARKFEKQKLDERVQAEGADDDTEELKRCLEIVPEDDDDVAIEATPISSKSPTIVDYKIYKERKKSYFKITRADGNSQNYLTFGTMFKNFNREDLKNMVYYLPVEKMYPFTNSILRQLWKDVRLQVDYEVEMAYDLLRLIRRQINKGPRAVNTARPRAVNIARPNSAVVNAVRVSQVNAVKASACWVWRPTKPNGSSKKGEEDHGYVDSGCSRHMTENMFYLSDFKEFDKGYVTFGGGANDGRITAKGTFKTASKDETSGILKKFITEIESLVDKKVKKDGSPLFDSSPKNAGDAGKKHDKVLDKDSGASNELNYAFENLNTEYPDDPEMPGLETIATYDDSEEEVDFTNLESLIHVSPTPTTRTHKNHPLKQIIGSQNTPVQTMSKLKPTNEQGFSSVVYEGKTHEDLNTCLFACFLSQIEPTRVAKALTDPD